jgi:protoporphyrinogen oxidase
MVQSASIRAAQKKLESVKDWIQVGPGLPDFSWYNVPKREKYTKMTTKFTKWPLDIPNGCQIFQMAINYTDIFHSKALQNIPNLDVWV